MSETTPHYPFNTDPALQASQELSRTRLDQLATLSQELQATMPEYEGMTAMGSTVRGEARPDSDVDILVFVRPDATSPRQNVNNEPGFDPNSIIEKGESQHLPQTFSFDIGKGMNYKFPINESLRQSGIPHADIEVLPISKEIVDEATGDLLTDARAYDEDPNIKPTGVARNIRALFQAPIDAEKLEPYMGQVLAKLGSNPHGETAWKMIRNFVVHFEKGREQESYAGVKHRYIPATLEEAKGYYLKPEQGKWDSIYGIAEQFGYGADEKKRADKIASLSADELMTTATTLHTYLAPENSHEATDYSMKITSPDGSNARELMAPQARAAYMQYAVGLVQKLAMQRTPGTEKQFLERAANIVALSLVKAHTFEDGNGRTARTFAHLIREGYDGGEEIKNDLKIAGTNRPTEGFRINSFLPTGKGSELTPEELLDVAAALDVPLEDTQNYKTLTREAFASPYA